jgi:hypothetical protein
LPTTSFFLFCGHADPRLLQAKPRSAKAGIWNDDDRQFVFKTRGCRYFLNSYDPHLKRKKKKKKKGGRAGRQAGGRKWRREERDEGSRKDAIERNILLRIVY